MKNCMSAQNGHALTVCASIVTWCPHRWEILKWTTLNRSPVLAIRCQYYWGGVYWSTMSRTSPHRDPPGRGTSLYSDPVSPGHGISLYREVPRPGGSLCGEVQYKMFDGNIVPKPPVNRQTDTHMTQNITLLQLHWRAVKIADSLQTVVYLQ